MAHSPLYVRIMNTRDWHEFRKLILTEQPCCAECARQGYVRASHVVHHKREIESGRTDQECWDLAFQRSNVEALCVECHHKIHTELRSHTRDTHKLRQQQRLEQWIQRQKGNRTTI